MSEPEPTALVVLTTFPNADTARTIAGRLLDEHLVACVTLLPATESHYQWQGERQSATEVPAMLKTTAGKYPDLESRLRSLHPYDVPEIIALPAVRVQPDYLDWIHDSCRPQ